MTKRFTFIIWRTEVWTTYISFCVLQKKLSHTGYHPWRKSFIYGWTIPLWWLTLKKNREIKGHRKWLTKKEWTQYGELHSSHALPSMPRLSKCVRVKKCARVQQDTSMVWLTCPTPSLLSECVHARLRDPSTEPALVREAVRERARRVILAEGTARMKEKEREMEERMNSYFMSTGKFVQAAWCVAEEAGMTCLNF